MNCKRIEFVEKVFREAPQYWWGDWMDVRFYLRERLSELQGMRVADVGCGAGLLDDALASSNSVIGVDTDSDSIAKARKRVPRARFIKGNSKKLSSGSFDVVIYSNLIEMVEDKPALLKEAARLLKPGGTLLLTTPNSAHPCYRGKPKLGYEELNSLLKPFFDFEVHGWNPFPPWPFFLPNRVLARVPGWYSFLKWLCESGRFPRSSKYFFVEAKKR